MVRENKIINSKMSFWAVFSESLKIADERSEDSHLVNRVGNRVGNRV